MTAVRADVAAMLRAGATYEQITTRLHVTVYTIGQTRRALNIPVPPGRGGTRREGIRDQVAAMLRDGATAAQVKAQLDVSSRLVTEVRREHGIPLPAGRTATGPKPRRDHDDEIAAMLTAGATYQQINTRLGISSSTIARVRRERSIPVTSRTTPHTPEQALARHSRPTPDGHTDWTGPTDGRGNPNVWANGRHNGLHLAFRLHHGREPHGRINRACTHHGCITGAHLTDHMIRNGLDPIERLCEAIFGT